MSKELYEYFDLCKSRIDEIYANPANYGYEANFLDKERGAHWENFTEAHQAILMDRFAYVYAENINEINSLKEQRGDSFNVIEYIAEKSIPLGLAGTPDETKNLFKDKLMARDGFVLEMPGISANVTQKEIDNRVEIFSAMGLDPDTISLRSKVGHSTYDLVIGNIDGNEVPAKEVIAGTLQGVHRKMEKKSQVTLMRESIAKTIEDEKAKPESEINLDRINALTSSLMELDNKRDERDFNAGSQVFIPSINAGRASSVVGDDLLKMGREIHERNASDSSPEFKGFTAGVSGNAMHYAISGMEFSRQVLKEEMTQKKLDNMYSVVEEHLVGTDQSPLHHSRPETKMGFEVGRVFATKVAANNIMDKADIKEMIVDCNKSTERFINFVKSKKLVEKLIKKQTDVHLTRDPISSSLINDMKKNRGARQV